MLDFQPLPNRDAWSTIRGYVYQVDLTVKRWLELEDQQVLELECGEDIDIVSPAFLDCVGDSARLLEQVKYREDSLTLRTSAALAMVCNADQHRRHNPNVALIFRYTTNATVAAERPSPLSVAIPAITAWEQIRVGGLDEATVSAVLPGIRSLLTTEQKPSGIAPEIWQRFARFVKECPASELLALIHSIEWSTGNPQASLLRGHIKALLLSVGHAQQDSEAEERYQRLFIYVLRLLCQSGRKSLTVASREEQLGLESVTNDDRSLMRRLATQLHDIETRLSHLEVVVSEHQEHLQRVGEQVRELARNQGITAAITDTGTAISLSLPPSLRHMSARTETVRQLSVVVHDHIWTAIDGSAGSGKTQLAILLCRAIGGHTYWLRLRDYPSEVQAAGRLDLAYLSITGRSLGEDYLAGFRRLCTQIGSRAVLVLDDMPRLDNGGEFFDRLVSLVQACQGSDVKILSVSAYPLPNTIRDYFDDQVVVPVTAPTLQDDDVKDILIGYGAPVHVVESGVATFANSLGRGHPILVTAIVRLIKQQEWKVTRTVLTRIFRGEYARDVSLNTIQRLVRTIQDEGSRNLLYRLSLTAEPFSDEDAQVIANVAPPVERAQERLGQLVGLWIQRDAEERLLISPLLKGLGETNVPTETRRRCHSKLGDCIVKRREIGQLEVLEALGHFKQSQEYNRAGSLLAAALQHLHSLDRPSLNPPLLQVWVNEPLPSEMDVEIRLLIRALQKNLLHERGQPTQYLTDDIDSLIESAPSLEPWAILAVVVFEPSYANRYLPRMLSLATSLKAPDGEPISPPEGTSLESLIWFHIYDIKTEASLWAWLSIVQEFTPEQRVQAFSGLIGTEGSRMVAERLWLEEARKSPSEADWESVLQILREFARQAREIDQELLWSNIVGVQANVLAEQQNDITAAETLVNEALLDASDDASVQFILHGTMVQHYMDARRFDDALTWASRALRQDTTAYPFFRMVLLLNASRAVAERDRQAAIDYAAQAVRTAKASPIIPPIEVVRTFGELAIAEWSAGSLRLAFAAFDNAAEALLANKADTADWKALCVIFGHVLGYFMALATTGSPPEVRPGGEEYMTPVPGILAARSTKAASRYRSVMDSSIVSGMASFAQGVGEDERAAVWLMRGLELARAGNHLLSVSQLAWDSVPGLIASARYAEALNAALEASSGLIALKVVRDQGGVPEDVDHRVEAILGPKPNSQWLEVETKARTVSLLPIAFDLARRRVEDGSAAKSYAAQLSVICRELQVSAADPTLWIRIADLLDDIFQNGVASRTLIDRVDTSASDYSMVLHALTFVGASVQQDCIPEMAIVLQIKVLSNQALAMTSTMYRRVIIPFLVTYWTDKLKKAAVRFRTPTLIGSRLEQAASLKVEDVTKVKAVLSVVCNGTDARLSADEVAWLNKGG